MSLIDQRIVIVASTDAIWFYLANPNMLTRWHQGCKQVSVLSTRPTGVGARRRVVGSDGRAAVEETTFWQENIGYEYVVIEGPYKSFRARFRLQVVPEGTLVNWTLEYRLKGLLAGLRNALNHQRKLEDQMRASLRQLKQTVEGSGAKINPVIHAKVAMQAAPSVEDRAARRPAPELTLVGGQSVSNARPIIVDEDDAPVPLPASRPTVPDRGTLTVPSIPVASTEPPVPSAEVGKTVVSVPSSPASAPANKPAVITDSEEDTKPRPPSGLREAIVAQKGTPTPVEPIDEIGDAAAVTVPISLVAPPRPPDPDTQTIELPAILDAGTDSIPGVPPALPEHIPTDPLLLLKIEESKKTPPKGISIFEPDPSLEDTHPTSPVIVPPVTGSVDESIVDEPEPQLPEVPLPDPSLPPPTDKEDTGQISIWERFGHQRPSEKTKAELEAVMAAITPPPIHAVDTATRVITARIARRKARPPVRGMYQKSPRQKRRYPVRLIAGVRSSH